jgi:hypothetical protein
MQTRSLFFAAAFGMAAHAAGAQTAPVLSQNFDAGTDGDWGEVAEFVTDGCGPDGSKCLRFAYEPTDAGSNRLTAKIPLPPAEEYTLRYKLMFEEGFEFVKGGKLPGFGPENTTTGCADEQPDGWSTRNMWRRDGEFVNYSYEQNRPNGCGRDYKDEGSPFRFQVGTYYTISQHVKVNTPGQADGIFETSVDGKLHASDKTVQFRAGGADGAVINSILFHTFFGGHDPSWAPSKTVYARFDDVEVLPGAAADVPPPAPEPAACFCKAKPVAGALGLPAKARPASPWRVR